MRKELLTFALVSLVVSIQPAQARGMGHGGGHSMAHGGARGGTMARGGGAAARGGARGGGAVARGGAVSRGGGVRGGSGLNAGGFNRSAAGGSRFQSLGGRNGFGRGNAFAGGNFANQTGNNIKSGKQFNNDPTKTYASNNGNTTNNVYASGSVNASGYPPASAAAYPAGYPAAYPTTYPAANPYAAGAAAGWAASKYNQATQPSYGYGYMPPVLPPITINAPTTTSQAPAGPAPTQQSSQSEELNNTATKARVFARNFASEVQAMRAQQMSRYANGQPIPQAVPYAVPQPITQSAR